MYCCMETSKYEIHHVDKNDVLLHKCNTVEECNKKINDLVDVKMESGGIPLAYHFWTHIVIVYSEFKYTINDIKNYLKGNKNE